MVRSPVGADVKYFSIRQDTCNGLAGMVCISKTGMHGDFLDNRTAPFLWTTKKVNIYGI
jgi:hypothetical protein